jgi:hypothetical protein
MNPHPQITQIDADKTPSVPQPAVRIDTDSVVGRRGRMRTAPVRIDKGSLVGCRSAQTAIRVDAKAFVTIHCEND